MKDRLLAMPVIGTGIRVQERYVADAADALAAAIGLFGFLSLIPLVALALAVVGFVLGNDPETTQAVVDAISESVPTLEVVAGGDTAVADAIEGLVESSGTLLGFGSIGLLLTSLRIASGAQQACQVVFRREPFTGLKKRLWQVAGLVVVGTFMLLSGSLGGSAGISLGADREVVDAAMSIVGTGVSYLADVAMFMLAYRMFTPGKGPSWRVLLPGSLLAAAAWLGLKLFGTFYITRQLVEARSTYGAIGSIIVLLLLLYLAGRVFLYGAELSAVRAGIGEEEEPAEEPAELVSPRPVRDVAPPPADLVRLTGAAAVFAFVVRALDD